MRTINDRGALRDVPSGEGYVLHLTPDLVQSWSSDVPDLSYAAEAGVFILPMVEGNLTTGDPVGDAYRAADLADKLDIDRSPTPPLVLRLPSGAGVADVQRYVPLWADATASRGYRPIIGSTPDVIFLAAQANAHFEGAYAEAFNLTEEDGTVQRPDDPRAVAGLPADVYPHLRGYLWTAGQAVADDELLAKVTLPRPAPVETQPSGPAPAMYVPAAAGQDELVDRIAQLAGEGTADLLKQISELRDLAQGMRDQFAGHLTELTDRYDSLAEDVAGIRSYLNDQAPGAHTDPAAAGPDVEQPAADSPAGADAAAADPTSEHSD